jgi:hypothetical protein
MSPTARDHQLAVRTGTVMGTSARGSSRFR